jgi:hypothetical protein
MKKVKELMPCVLRGKPAANKLNQLFPFTGQYPPIGSFCHLPGLISCRYVEQNVAAVCIVLSYVAKSTFSCFGQFIVRWSVVGMSTLPSSYKPLYLVAATLPELQ